MATEEDPHGLALIEQQGPGGDCLVTCSPCGWTYTSQTMEGAKRWWLEHAGATFRRGREET